MTSGGVPVMTTREGREIVGSLSRKVEDLITQWLAEPMKIKSTLPALEQAVRSAGALPIYSDIGATIFLRPDGAILIQPHHSDDAPVVEERRSWRILALSLGAEKYPEIRDFLPQRPSGSDDCLECGGSGRFKVAELTFVCNTCHGIGWVAEAA
jgi:hypothetical protein